MDWLLITFLDLLFRSVVFITSLLKQLFLLLCVYPSHAVNCLKGVSYTLVQQYVTSNPPELNQALSIHSFKYMFKKCFLTTYR